MSLTSDPTDPAVLAARSAARSAARRRRQPPRPGPFVRARRMLTATSALLVLLAGLSWGVAMTARSDSSLSIRTVEWLRSNGLRGLVNTAESIYYSWTAPSKGGPALKALPKVPGHELAVRRAHARAVALAYRPPDIAPVIHPALAGEGVWRETFPVPAGQAPPVLVTSYRPQPDYPQIVAGVAWINHLTTSVTLFPGISEPAVAMPNRGPEEVPMSLRPRLVATFNSAFKLSDSGGGFVYGGHTYAPMAHGLATVVRYRNGRVNVIAWPYGATAPPSVVYARQNLPLIIDHGVINPNLSDGPQWGATLGNAVQVWRSGLGIDRHGNLIYAAANYQTVGSLAAILRHAGAVRAMELDINAYWPGFITYSDPGAVGAANLLPGMVRSPQRYLTPDDRDFFTVTLRRP
jgi:hypothetical protein